MIDAIKNEVVRRQITRLCHFTPSRNLIHIASGEVGLLATDKLEKSERHVFNPTDLQRLDGHKGFISCSVEYPNAWYFDVARAKDTLFKDWVVLFINPRYLWTEGTRFCCRNAAAGRGSEVSEGAEAFMAMFAEQVIGAGGISFRRTSTRPASCPTDDQAEVLVPDRIAIEDIIAIAVSNATQAKNEAARFKHAKVLRTKYNLLMAPDLFDKRRLSAMIREGKRPIETPWPTGQTDDK